MAGIRSGRRLVQLLPVRLSFVPVRNKKIIKSESLTLFELNKKGTSYELPPGKREMLNVGEELKQWFRETNELIHRNPMLKCEHGNYEVIFRFNNPAAVKSWIVSTDKDNDTGKSSAEFTFTKNSTGLFHGYLSKEVPKDGKTKYAGYANITCPKPLKAFKRDTSWDWSLFNCMLLKVRGDGRPYSLVIGCNFEFDINWLNRWQCPLYTRGGPYWQLAKVPFSNFFLSHHGRIQDKQEYPELTIVNSLGITVMDAAEGPFALEIESIALMYDMNLSDTSRYETYHLKNFMD
ncbi:complex I intermediate-associated protein 30, mitochondrial-like [Physella acuta]|uniref:complex I intermediate-associated protein 30, mitochondrial-like n=1 Tax=Physella acuta TaxID=109671 RepID=UPI0027DC0B80|nr:complex I intermediate-associated protein 30, mitochondrial-like [Physella acuta]XP_059157517.1 complex I intermediate-associated protein 30, mitochondrial-like [Physella acuta]XP_059157518.1 complex I intermediate-associated protein 30, mitochondrial-like [Physella acuta]XP_059157519.1 complex I intermediate-associated protein 30, mitochondrial-like [Physella acuta]XP_059157520.1 complex I intermediate-associated protein 30, mitochondrial-like [Physella acuta]